MNVHSRARDIATWLLWRTGLASLARALLASKGRFVLVFHGVAQRRYTEIPPHVQPSISVDELHQVLCWLRNHHFHFLTPKEFLASNKPGVLLTFDDGLANNYTNALPVLVEFSAPAIFFVSTQHVICPRDWLPATRALARGYWEKETAVPEDIAADLYDGLSPEQLAACAQSPLITVGSHTVSHPSLTQCHSTQLEFELAESKRILEEASGQNVSLFAYPTEDYNRTVAEAVRACGYRAAFAEDTHNIGLPAFEIPRIGIYAASPAYLSLKLSGLHRRPIIGQPPGILSLDV